MAAYGGMEQHICLLAERCRASGLPTTLLSTSNSLNGTWRTRLQNYGVDLREMQCKRGNSSNIRKMIWLFLCAVQQSSKPRKVVYTNGQSGLAQVAWRAAGRSGGTIHHHHTAGDQSERSTWNRQYCSVLANCGRLVACSKSSRHELSEGIGRSDVEYYPYITPTIVDSDDIQSSVCPGGRNVHFGFFGRLVQTKGIDLICSLSEEIQLSNVFWEIFGKGEHYSAESFSNYRNIIYQGEYRNSEHYHAALGRLDATILLSAHNEGMPLSLIEAMGAGLSWVATDKGGTRELSFEENNVEIIPNNAPYPTVLVRICKIVQRVTMCRTSRKSQRKVYDLFFASDASAETWISLFKTYGYTSDTSLP